MDQINQTLTGLVVRSSGIGSNQVDFRNSVDNLEKSFFSFSSHYQMMLTLSDHQKFVEKTIKFDKTRLNSVISGEKYCRSMYGRRRYGHKKFDQNDRRH